MPIHFDNVTRRFNPETCAILPVFHLGAPQAFHRSFFQAGLNPEHYSHLANPFQDVSTFFGKNRMDVFFRKPTPQLPYPEFMVQSAGGKLPGPTWEIFANLNDAVDTAKRFNLRWYQEHFSDPGHYYVLVGRQNGKQQKAFCGIDQPLVDFYVDDAGYLEKITAVSRIPEIRQIVNGLRQTI